MTHTSAVGFTHCGRTSYHGGGHVLAHERGRWAAGGDVTSRPDAERAAATANVRDVSIVSRPAATACCVGFLLSGAIQALYGPAIPVLSRKFELSPSAAGFGLSAYFLGGVAGVLLFDRLLGLIGDRRLIGASFCLMAAGAAGFALAPNWPVALVMTLLAGLGFGGVDNGVNRLFTIGFGHRSTAMLNILNAFYGVGAILGPALIGVVGARHYPEVFLAFAVAILPTLPFLRGVRQRIPPAPDTAPRPGAVSMEVLKRGAGSLLAAFLVIYVLHVGVETGVGGWEPTHLEAVGFGASFAAAATSLYWLMMTIGRFLVAPIALRFSAQAIITVSCAGMTVCSLLAAVPPAAPFAYAGVGLFLAPIFPTGLTWLNEAVPGVRWAGTLVIAGSMAGGGAAGPALGEAIELSGVRAVPLVLCGVSALCLVATLWLNRATRASATHPRWEKNTSNDS